MFEHLQIGIRKRKLNRQLEKYGLGIFKGNKTHSNVTFYNNIEVSITEVNYCVSHIHSKLRTERYLEAWPDLFLNYMKSKYFLDFIISDIIRQSEKLNKQSIDDQNSLVRT